MSRGGGGFDEKAIVPEPSLFAVFVILVLYNLSVCFVCFCFRPHIFRFDCLGSESQQCDSNGQCKCKPGVTGEKCDRCEANYYDFGIYGCRACNCKDAGSQGNTPYCDSTTGQCNCKVSESSNISVRS